MNGQKWIDVHLHTTASDGSDTPAELVKKAKAAGLAAIAVTDHDTVDGLAEAMKTGAACGIEVLPGIEFSTDYRGEDVHVLGYLFDPASAAMAAVMAHCAEERETRNAAVCAKLRVAGYDITYAQVKARFPHAIIGRPHIARMLMESGQVSSIRETIVGLMQEGKPCYVRRERMPFADAPRHIRASGGVPVLAHPLQYGFSDLRQFIADAAEVGILGVEAYYSGYTAEQSAALCALTQEFGLFVTGGTDYHGANKPDIAIGSGKHGEVRVPYACIESLREAKKHI